MTNIGLTRRGTPIIVNDLLLGTDLVIGIGSVAIHPFAGLSGGPKAFVPGCAGRATINANHSLLLSAQAAPGELATNPLYHDLLEATAMIRENLYIINEALSPDGSPVGYYFGTCRGAHAQAASQALLGAAVHLEDLYDTVIASAGGAPRDINLYQSIKALEMASLACRDGGKLILLAACPEGIGSKLYEEWARKGIGEQTEMVQTRFTVGAHKAFLASRALQKLSMCVLVSSLDPALSREMGFTPARTLDDALELVGPLDNLSVAAMPFATATLPQNIIRESAQA
jgi:nickel-dependent lactate racemase